MCSLQHMKFQLSNMYCLQAVFQKMWYSSVKPMNIVLWFIHNVLHKSHRGHSCANKLAKISEFTSVVAQPV